MSLLVPSLLAAVLAGLGVYGVLARRNAVLVLIGAELLVNAGVLILVIADARLAARAEPLLIGQVGALFAITVAAAEIGLALAVVLMLFRVRRSVDLRGPRRLGQHSTAGQDSTAGRDGRADTRVGRG